MFKYLRRRALIAGVAAEIKAQCKSQEFVRQVCFTPSGGYTIIKLGEERFTKKGRFRYFIIATFLLAETIRTYNIPISIKTACLELLHVRRAQIERNMDGGYGPAILSQDDIDDLDEIIDIGIQLLDVERRETTVNMIEEETGMDLSWMKERE